MTPYLHCRLPCQAQCIAFKNAELGLLLCSHNVIHNGRSAGMLRSCIPCQLAVLCAPPQFATGSGHFLVEALPCCICMHQHLQGGLKDSSWSNPDDIVSGDDQLLTPVTTSSRLAQEVFWGQPSKDMQMTSCFTWLFSMRMSARHSNAI